MSNIQMVGELPILPQSEFEKAWLRRSYLKYCMHVHRGKWIPGRHHILIANALDDVINGKIKRLMIWMPPRHGKSMEITETFPSYFLGKFPDKRVIEVSYIITYKGMCEIQSICSSLGICLNTKKTQIVKLSHGFTFLHAYFRLTPSGKVVKTMKRTNTVRMRRKLKSLSRLLAQRRISTQDLNEAFQSWRTYAQGFCSYRTVRSMEMLYTQLLSKEANTE